MPDGALDGYETAAQVAERLGIEHKPGTSLLRGGVLGRGIQGAPEVVVGPEGHDAGAKELGASSQMGEAGRGDSEPGSMIS